VIKWSSLDVRYSGSEPISPRFPDSQIVAGAWAVGFGQNPLLHLLAGLRLPSSGALHVDQTNLTALSESGRDAYRCTKVGYLLQDFFLLEGYTALENVLLGLGVAGIRGREALTTAKNALSRAGFQQVSDSGWRLCGP